MTLHTQGLQTFDDIRAFVTGSQAADFEIDSRDDAYGFVRDTLRRFGYRRCRRADKGLLRRDLITVTDLSRAQITRLIGQYRQSGRVRDRRGRRRGRLPGVIRAQTWPPWPISTGSMASCPARRKRSNEDVIFA